MAKNSTKTEVSTPEHTEAQKHKVVNVFGKLVWTMVVLSVVVLVWKNPQLFSAIGNQLEKYTKPTENKEIVEVRNTDRVAILKQEIAGLRDELTNIANKQDGISKSDVEELKNRFVTMEKTNLEILDAKADASAVLGIVSRLDKLEEQVDTLSKVTDDSALILTAVLMVKDTAERGSVFSYEAEILSQLAQNNIKIKEPIAIIEKTALEGVKSDVYLVNRFDDIYKDVSAKQKKEFERNWRDRINSKINEFVKIRRTNQATEEAKFNKPLDDIKMLVDEEDFAGALLLLNRVDNKEWVEKYPALTEWIGQVENKLSFNAAIKQIANNSLAVMKVNSIKKEIKND